MSSQKEYEMLFKLNAQLGGSYNSSFKSASQSLVQMQNELQALNKTQSDISSYQKHQAALSETTAKLADQRAKLANMQEAYENMTKGLDGATEETAGYANKLIDQEAAVRKAETSLHTYETKLSNVSQRLNEAGVNTENLSGETQRLAQEYQELKQKQEEAANQSGVFSGKNVAAVSAIQQALAVAGIAAAVKAITNEIKECTDASIEFESAMAGVRRTVGGSDEEIAAMSASFKQMSQDIPITTTELASIAETAGQLGIAKEVVTDFTEIMAMLGTATDLTAENAATMLAQFANITGLDPKDYDRLGATVADLGDATATTASKVVDMSQGMAAAATIAGFSETDILAVSAAVGSLGIEAQAGSTAMSTLIQTLYKAVETGSDKLADFAAVAGVSADEFETAWGDDAVSAMDAFIQGLNDTERNGRSAVVILDELGITNVRQTKAILGLANAGDLLSNTIEQANQAWEENTALQEKADIMYGTTESQLVLLQSAYNNLKIAVGDNYTPALQEAAGVGSDMLNSATAFVQEHPEVVKAVTVVAGVVGTVTVALTAYSAAAKIAALASKLLTESIPGIGLVLKVTAGVAALAGVVTLFASANKEAEDEVKSLSAASQEQYYELQALQVQYEEACAVYDETSAELRLLKKELDDATAAFEENKRTTKEAVEVYKGLYEAYNESVSAYEDSIGGIEREATANSSLTDKLEELMAVEGKTAATKQEILTVVEMLNEAMPELGLAYDEYSDSLNLTADGIRKVVQAEIEQEKYVAGRERLKQLERDLPDYYEAQQAAIADVAAAQRKLVTAQEQYNALLDWASESANTRSTSTLPDFIDGATRSEIAIGGISSVLRRYGSAVAQAEDELESFVDAQQEADGVYNNTTAEIEQQSQALATYSEETKNATGAMNALISSVSEQMSELVEAYQDAYDAALSSIEGQYSLWDKAETVVATSAGSINSALESQISYWQNYNTNLASLGERTSDVEGLSEMIASFADGSKDSVNAVAGMAGATNDDLRKMVANWQELQKEQKATSDSIAKLVTDFPALMDELQSDLETAIAEMDLSKEAAESGRNTIQSFIDGSEDMLPAVEAAYARIAKAALGAIGNNLKLQTIGPVDTAGISAYASGTLSAAPGLALVGEKGPELINFGGGEVVYTTDETRELLNANKTYAEEAQLVAFAPQLMTILSSFGANNAVTVESATSAGRDSVPLELKLNFSITGDVPENIREQLQEYGDDIVDAVIDRLEDMGIDVARRAYR